MSKNDNLVVEGAKINFRNFAGKPGKFNAKGNRNFCIFLESEVGEKLAGDGWNIRWLAPKDENDAKIAYLQIAVAYNNFPPNIYLVTKKNKTLLNEESIELLDWAEIQYVDAVIRPYDWAFNGKEGRKAYVQSMYVVINEDEFADKYRNVPDSAQNSMMNNDEVV